MLHVKRTHDRISDPRHAYLLAGFLAAALIISTAVSASLERRLNVEVSRQLRGQLYECAESLDAYVDSTGDARLAAALRFANASKSLRLDDETRGALELLARQLTAPLVTDILPNDSAAAELSNESNSNSMSSSNSLSNESVSNSLSDESVSNGLSDESLVSRPSDELALTQPSDERLRALADIFYLLASRSYYSGEARPEEISSEIASELTAELTAHLTSDMKEPLAPEPSAIRSLSASEPEKDELSLKQPQSAALSRITRRLSRANAINSLSLLLGANRAELDLVDSDAGFTARSGNLRAEFSGGDGRLVEYIHIRLGAPGGPLAESELYSRAVGYARELYDIESEPLYAISDCGFALYGWDGCRVVLDSAGKLYAILG